MLGEQAYYKIYIFFKYKSCSGSNLKLINVFMLCYVTNLFFVSFAAGAPYLIFSNGRDLLIGDIHGNNLRTLVNSQNRGVAVGVDFHYNLHRIFWTDTIQNKVFFKI